MKNWICKGLLVLTCISGWTPHAVWAGTELTSPITSVSIRSKEHPTPGMHILLEKETGCNSKGVVDPKGKSIFVPQSEPALKYMYGAVLSAKSVNRVILVSYDKATCKVEAIIFE